MTVKSAVSFIDEHHAFARDGGGAGRICVSECRGRGGYPEATGRRRPNAGPCWTQWRKRSAVVPKPRTTSSWSTRRGTSLSDPRTRRSRAAADDGPGLGSSGIRSSNRDIVPDCALPARTHDASRRCREDRTRSTRTPNALAENPWRGTRRDEISAAASARFPSAGKGSNRVRGPGGHPERSGSCRSPGVDSTGSGGSWTALEIVMSDWETGTGKRGQAVARASRTTWAEFERGRQRPRSTASARRSAISRRASGLFSSKKVRTSRSST